MKTSDFEYRLPPERIAQAPLPERDASRLLVLDKRTGAVAHRVFRDLPSLLGEGDLLVLNDTRVIPARLYGRREATGGRVEVLLIENRGGGRWLAFTKSGGRLLVGEALKLADGLARAVVLGRLGEEGDLLEVEAAAGSVDELLEKAGRMPVPPYIKRKRDSAPNALDRERYQTVYAREPGAVAAPTAGLHFTERVFADLDARGVRRTFVTLHVGPGTFRPVKSEAVEAHRMDAERYEVPPGAAREVRECRARGGRVVAVGTTVTRTLESAACPPPRLADGRATEDDGDRQAVREGPGVATLFITQGYEFRVVDALVTNFHLPRGTPLVLVSAFAGRERVLAAYDEALAEGYRFLSYGDAMAIL